MTPSDLNELSLLVRASLRAWHDSTPDSPLAHLHLVRHQTGPEDAHFKVNRILMGLIGELGTQTPVLAQILRLRFWEREDSFKVANQLNLGESTVNRKQREAIEEVARLLQRAEQEAQAEERSQAESVLEPPTYDELFGAEEVLAKVLGLLHGEGAPWLVLLQGIGGLGKTALADQIMRRAIEQGTFRGFGWVSARTQHFGLGGSIHTGDDAQQTAHGVMERLTRQILGQETPVPYRLERALPLLQEHLRQRPCLITVDNLETLEDVQALLPMLTQLAQPSKFLITSRQGLPNAAQVYPVSMQPLAQADALALIRHEAQARNLPPLVEASEMALLPIFEAVGGNPLALRLVVGQTRRHALKTVLTDLRMARGQGVENLYTYIYRRAWETLTEPERQALLAMPLTPPDGADFAYLTQVSALPEDALHDALETLINLSLVDHRPGLAQSRYTIHSLTRTFLLEQVIRWG
jgi:hypothetical protein